MTQKGARSVAHLENVVLERSLLKQRPSGTAPAAAALAAAQAAATGPSSAASGSSGASLAATHAAAAAAAPGRPHPARFTASAATLRLQYFAASISSCA